MSVSPEYLTSLWGDVTALAITPGMTIKGRRNLSGITQRILPKTRSLAQRESAPGPDGTEPAEPVSSADYELLEVLGEGGMGIVYTAHQTSVGRKIALKMLKPDAQQIPQAQSQLLAEAAITGNLDHPGIVPVHEIATDENGATFYTMKQVHGTPWSDALSKKTLMENLEILLRVADAVAFAHSHNVIHRDLKPENVMLGDYGEVMVMDWGLAVFLSDLVDYPDSVTPCGTPAYMSPEMVLNDLSRMGIASDVYLLGGILYRIVTGMAPHTGADTVHCLLAVVENQIQPTNRQSELVQAALKAMAAEPGDRYPDVKAFQAAIRECLSHMQSMSLVSRGVEYLTRAERTKEYQDFARAMFSYEEAFALWNGNENAKQSAEAARMEYASCAMERGDLDLAQSLLRENRFLETDLGQEVERKLRERASHKRQAFFNKTAAISLAIMAAVILSVAYARLRLEQGKVLKEQQKALAEMRRGNEAEGVASSEKDKAVAAKKAVENALAEVKQSNKAKEAALVERDEAVAARKVAENALAEVKQSNKAKEEAALLERDQAVAARKAAEDALAEMKRVNAKTKSFGTNTNASTSTSPQQPKDFAAAAERVQGDVIALPGVVREWAAEDPVAAAQWVQQMRGGRQAQINATGALVSQWVLKDTAAVAQWARQLPEGGFKETAVLYVAYEWGRKDMEAADKWVKQLPGGPAKAGAERALKSIIYGK